MLRRAKHLQASHTTAKLSRSKLMPVIYEDTRQQMAHGDKHATKHRWWNAHSVEVVRRKLDTGDYMTDGSNVTVDTKKGLEEIAANIGGRAHRRFSDECKRAQESGLRLVVLVECVGYASMTDVRAWTNTHCRKCGKACNPHDPRGKCMRHGTRKPIQGARLVKAMQTMAKRYGVEFVFVRPQDAARYICERLGVDYEQ